MWAHSGACVGVSAHIAQRVADCVVVHPCRIMASIRSTYLTDDGFTPENAKRASPAAEGLCKWVHAMSKYDKVRRQRAQPSATAGC